MKRYFKKLMLVILSASLLSGCATIPDKASSLAPAETAESAESSEQTEEPVFYNEASPQEYYIFETDVSMKLNAEGGVFDSAIRTDGSYDGNGYVLLENEATLVHIAEIPYTQHYRIMLAAFSYDGAAISLSAGKTNIGTYYIPPSEEAEFTLFSVDNLFFESDPVMLTLQMISGTAAIDYILIEDSKPVSDDCYDTRSRVVGKNTGMHTISTMKYMTDIYGERILTAQNVTPGTNAEIDAVFDVTGRYPAIRCGDLIYSSTNSDEEYAETAEKEIELALEWGRNNGIVSFGWHWYSPHKYGSHYYTELTLFELSDAVTELDLTEATPEELQSLYENESITEDCYLLIQDIDNIAKQLLRFKDEEITVLWQPLPDGETDLYWWGGSADDYKWLWRFMFERMNTYHKLNNLIWVWNGSSEEFYPGDYFCDIIGQGMFLDSDASFADRFSALSALPDAEAKPVAITACDVSPSPDHMNRDNAMWLWTSIQSGEYIINSDGSYTEAFTDKEMLNAIYNAKLTVARDELPDIYSYALKVDETVETSTHETVQTD
ncbi:MAG: hypothetical protein IJZ95_01040 [Oscillospiraceae bacterium]|nr:hypothetical protein [Oscillospiraceae bacterium]